jgi:para-nitrobenzyl esterase
VTGADSVAQEPGPEVRAAAGRLRGDREAGVTVFRGIPFARPPVGEFRFAAPQPVQGWGGVRDATSYGPPPPQGGHFGMDGLSQDGTDDWLTLNVWSPEPFPGAGLPVMVWIQGGGYVIGMSSLPEYDGARLARDGVVVVVTFNYRVGIEGFAQIEGAPANRGLLDQVAALEWVRDNIRAFGGEPDRVTVFGQSAGGGSVAALLAMDRAAGLFGRAVVQSAPGTFFSPDLATDIAAACAAELGLRPTAVDLSRIDPRRLSAVADTIGSSMDQMAHRWGLPAHRAIPFAPVVDGEVLSVTPWQALTAGAGRGIDLLVGHTRDEQRLFTAIEGLLGEVGEEQAATALQVFAPGPDGERRYRDAYPMAGPDELYELVHSDWLFRMPSLHLAEAQTAAGGRAHVYELTWQAPGMGGVLGACHGLDVPLVFGNLDRGQPALLIGATPSPEAEALSARMRTAWTSFAADGDPGWPAYDTGQRLAMRFDTQPAVTGYLEEASRLIWQGHAFPALPLNSERGHAVMID